MAEVTLAAAHKWSRLAVVLGVSLLAAQAQVPEWRAVGKRVVDSGLAGLSGGGVTRVWYSAGGATMLVKTALGPVYETSDFETWTLSSSTPPGASEASASGTPEPAAKLRTSGAGRPLLVYAFGTSVFRSNDGGSSWDNVSRYQGRSILGDAIQDLAVSPRDPEEIAVATASGVWRSLDGGSSWASLNAQLPNFPGRRLLRVPGGSAPARVALESGEAVWVTGSKAGWQPANPDFCQAETALKAALSRVLGWEVLSVASTGDWVYAGGRAGRLAASPDQGRTWRPFALDDAGDITSIFVAASEPRAALAALDGPVSRVVRTINGGIFWDDITGNLPAGRVNGLTADASTGAVYAATSAGLALSYTDLLKAGAAGAWQIVGGLPNAPVLDVKLDDGGNQLYALVAGYALYGTTAPHRMRDPRIVNAADYSTRPAAPGSLLSVLGTKVASARAGELEVPVLAASPAESQIQVPFGATGNLLTLALSAQAADGSIVRRDLRVPLQTASPAIFVDADGAPMLLDADRGILLDATTPAKAGERIQLLVTGLGAVTPNWPTGMPAPLENAPRVVAPVKVYIDRIPVEVTRATLAPGYVGFYLVEVQAPDIVNIGPAELYVEAGGQESGRVTIYLTQ